ncbi:hypothetical protein M426DRAFT_318527 [Hypoxylon sp. CI-4A]|nr:hypothetical protein M426DRAFT_318527 [Hypoxylon sp. CI-4A]
MGSEQKQESSPVAAAAELNAKPTVCFLGPVSSYTHQATLDTFPGDKFDLIPVQTIKDIFDTTQSGRAAYGVVPFENSSNGSVVFTLDQFADRNGEYPDLSVCAEIYLDVHHCFLGYHAPPPLLSQAEASETQTQPQPQTRALDLKHVKRIYSHPQAFGQCAKFLASHLRGVETVDVSSTSRAAQLAKADGTGESAAISSAAAARLLGIDILARNIEDRADNTTRFFVVRRGPDSAVPSPGGEVLDDVLAARRRPERKRKRGEGDVDGDGDETIQGVEEEVGGEGEGEGGGVDDDIYSRTKSLASFTVPHRSPGALADVLECFRRSRLNLTSINSRPSLVEPFQYVFFVEFEGHLARDPEGRVKDVLRSVAEVAQRYRWLGSWDRMR